MWSGEKLGVARGVVLLGEELGEWSEEGLGVGIRGGLEREGKGVREGRRLEEGGRKVRGREGGREEG